MLQAYHNDPSIKEGLINQLQAHYDADEIIKGKYWEDGKGCAVGCTIHSSNHALYEKMLGLPTWIANAEDIIFEGLPNRLAKEWPLRFSKAIKPGSNIDLIKIPFLICVVESVIDKFDHDQFPDVKKSIENVLEILKNPSSGATRAAEAAEAAGASAWAAAEDVGDSAWATAWAAARAAEDAARASAWAAAWAARAASRAAAWAADDAEEKTYMYFADKLIDLIENCD